MHWSDSIAKKISSKNKNIKELTVASGITPSGKIHVGNLREVLTVEFVRCSLKKLGISTRFLFFWDDYDPLRKVPENLSNKETLQKSLGKALTFVEDPCGKHENYAKHFEKEVEQLFPSLGIDPEYVYQSDRYKNGFYREEILFCLKNQVKIKKILNRYRTVPLEEDWSPFSIYCKSCDVSNSLKSTSVDRLGYSCESCKFCEEISPPFGNNIKLVWRVDWPMRWSKENVYFEPAGKDHSSDGGSRQTGEIICKEIFNVEPPVYLNYDFIGIKGKAGKMSSSSGILVGIDEILRVYEPEIVRYLFASYKNNAEFTIGLDLDVIKLYEEYDRAERVYFGVEEASEKREEIIKRSYELAQIMDIPQSLPLRISFRHLCNLIQIFDSSLERVLLFLGKKNHITYSSKESTNIKSRFERASYWLEEYAPEDFIFRVRKDEISAIEITPKFLTFFKKFFSKMYVIKDSENMEEQLELYFYKILKEENLVVSEVYKKFYEILIHKDRGPKLIQFLIIIGIDSILDRNRFFDFSSKKRDNMKGTCD